MCTDRLSVNCDYMCVSGVVFTDGGKGGVTERRGLCVVTGEMWSSHEAKCSLGIGPRVGIGRSNSGREEE